MTTSDKILGYVAKNNQASGKELTEYLGDISSRAVRKQLKNHARMKLLMDQWIELATELSTLRLSKETE